MASYDQEAEYSMTDDNDRTTSVMDPISHRSPGGVEGNDPVKVSRCKVRFVDIPTVYPAPPTHSTAYDDDRNLELDNVTRSDDYSSSADSILINDPSSPDLKLSSIPNERSGSGSATQSSPVTNAPHLLERHFPAKDGPVLCIDPLQSSGEILQTLDEKTSPQQERFSPVTKEGQFFQEKTVDKGKKSFSSCDKNLNKLSVDTCPFVDESVEKLSSVVKDLALPVEGSLSLDNALIGTDNSTGLSNSDLPAPVLHSNTAESLNSLQLIELQIVDSLEVSVNGSTVNGQLPHIRTMIHGQLIDCLIDTGSSANLINSKLVTTLKLTNIQPSKVNLCSINKTPIKVHGETIVSMMIGSKLCNVDVIVADINSDVVLGNPFICDHKALLDMNDQSVTIPGVETTSVPITPVNPIASTYSVDREHCLSVSNHTVKPNHGKWIKLQHGHHTLPLGKSGIIYPILSHLSPAQRLNSNHSITEALFLVINNTDSPLSISKGDQIGYVEWYDSSEFIPLSQVTDSRDSTLVPVNGTYALELTDSEKTLRWTELCKVLKSDKWELSQSEVEEAKTKLKEYEFCFALEHEPLGILKNYEHQIEVGSHKPISQRPRPLTGEKREALDEIIDDLLQRGIIRPSRSPWSSPVCLVRKGTVSPNGSKDSDKGLKKASWRLCVDYRKTNECIVRDSFPLPNISHLLASMKHSKFFSVTDLASGFHQLKIRETDIPITAFCTEDGLWEYITIPMGLSNSPPSFVRAITNMLKSVKDFAICYLDDICIIGTDFESHLRNLCEVLNILRFNNLKLKAGKSKLFKKELEFVGHVISEEGITYSESRIECIRYLPVPRDPKSLRSYLGTMGYFRKYCKDFSKIARPLFKLAVADKTDFIWSDEAELAFSELKRILTSPPVLALPRDDDQFILTTDASGVAIGSVLTVTRPEGRRVIAYASHLLEKSRQNYPCTQKELYAVVYYVQFHRSYLQNRHFYVETDHRALKFLKSFKEPSSLVHRWINILTHFDFTVLHKAKTFGLIKVADCLSRPTKDNDTLSIAKLLPDGTFKSYLAELPDNTDNEAEDNEALGVKTASKLNESLPGSHNRSMSISTENEPCNSLTVAATTIAVNDTNDGNVPSTEPVPLVNVDQDQVVNTYVTEIANAQNQDVAIKTLKDRLVNSPTSTILQIALDPPVTKFYWSFKDRIKIENDILYYRDNKNRHKIIVPSHKVNDIMKLTHDHATAGHRSAQKMLQVLKPKYHWFKMKDDIEMYVKRCRSCGVHKKPRANRPRAPLYMTRTSSKFERLAIDFAGPFTRTARNNRFILLGLFTFTKFAFAVPMSCIDSEHVARALIERWITFFGVPLEIHSDAAPNLVGELMQQLYRLLDIKLTHNLPYMPQSNGAAERLVSTLKNMLCHFAVSKHRQWDFMLPMIVLAYNSTYSAVTKCTPQQMVTGENVRVSLDLAFGPPPIIEDIYELDYIAWLRETLYEIHEYARDNMAASIQSTKDRFDKGQFGKALKENDLVWKLKGRFETGSRKWQKKYDGIYIVISQKSNTSYLIRHVHTNKEEIAPFNRLKRAYVDPNTLELYIKNQLNEVPRSGAHSEQDQGEVENEPVLIAYRSPQNQLLADQPVPLAPIQQPRDVVMPLPATPPLLPVRRRYPRRVINRIRYNLRPRPGRPAY